MVVMSYPHKTFLIFILMALTIALNACGFHLRGEVNLPDHLTPIFLDLSTSDNELSRELLALLSSSKKNILATSKAEANTILEISAVQKQQRVVAVDNLGRAREYELKYQFIYSLKKNVKPPSPEKMIKTNAVKLKRNWLFDPSSVLAVAHEKESLYIDMRKDAARVMLRQLVAIKK